MIILMFIIGLIMGSFYLVIASRLPKGEDVLFSRSHCDKCGYILKWYNLIPVLSFIFQRGRCTNCKEKIDPEHLIVELITGILFAFCYYYYGISYEFFMSLGIISLTIIIYISDCKYMIILDSPLIVMSLLAIILKFIYYDYRAVLISILSGIFLFCVMLLVRQIGRLLFKREALGGGDIKLAFVIGLVLDYKLGLIALVLSTFLALPYCVASLYLVKNHEVPYGPFLVGAMVVVFLTMDKFLVLFDTLFRF